MIEIRNLSKRFGPVLAVDGLTFEVTPGRITGFLGPNGAGKSTTMRLILGLDAPTAGTAAIAGRPYRELRDPLREVGALLDAGAVHGGRTAVAHLRWIAAGNRISPTRVAEVLDAVGIATAAGRRIRTYSLGMRQRLGIAAALLGDPGVLMFDEPVNGLDPEGVRWLRVLLRGLADEGRTVLLSSHLMSEMAQVADHLVIVGRGRLLADTPLTELLAAAGGDVLVRTPEPPRLADLLTGSGSGSGATVDRLPDSTLAVQGLSAERIADLAAEHGVRIHQLTSRHATLEDAYMELTADHAEFHAGGVATTTDCGTERSDA
ncbi:ABC-2 type transport system ATP-binding protein [Catenulispora sp. GAS73]|uniref:ABC transporter ATP-binding protein n=1 Tax=Catenulispora sp. GAS73 TaxID=3156269 RepID=UPI003510F69B